MIKVNLLYCYGKLFFHMGVANYLWSIDILYSRSGDLEWIFTDTGTNVVYDLNTLNKIIYN